MKSFPFKSIGGRTRAFRAFELSLCVVGVIVVFCSLLAFPESSLKTLHNTRAAFSTEPLSIPQINCRFTPSNIAEGIKQKKAAPAPLNLYYPLRYYIDSLKNGRIISLHGVNGIFGKETKQVYLLLDLPPPFLL